jgi:antitoxin component of RelBE/YafQ-DinJ toxin-antitoxin module
MRKINFSEPKITLRLTPKLKRKAAEIAENRGLSISQLVEELLRQASSDPMTAEIVRGIVNDELRKNALTIEVVKVLVRAEMKRALKPSSFNEKATAA